MHLQVVSCFAFTDVAKGEPPAPRYRLYFLDREGRIRRAMDLDCDDDAEAVQAMEARDEGGGMELWEAARLVKKVGGAL